jgi:ABC-2 type transport system ATP-binding protein
LSKVIRSGILGIWINSDEITTKEKMPLLSLKQLNKHLSGKKILDGIDLEIACGEFVGLIGPNGSGKTTLVRCISGQLLVNSNTVFVNGVDLQMESVKAKSYIGVALDPALLPPQLTGSQFLELWASARQVSWQDKTANTMISIFNLGERLADEIHTYSLGMKQKLGIVAAMLGDPELLILDESLSSLDPLSSWNFKKLLRQKCDAGRLSILMTSHIIESIEKYCDRVLMIDNGSICQEWTKEELQKEREQSGLDLEEMFIRLSGKQKP